MGTGESSQGRHEMDHSQSKTTVVKMVLGRRFANAEVLFVGGEEGKWTKPNHFCSVAIR